MQGKRKWFPFAARESHPSEGVNDAWWLTHKSLGRENSDVSPYLIPNEWICANIGMFLRLPIPPFALMREGPGHKGMFASLKFGAGDVPPNDADPSICVTKMPDLCSGVLLFDILIANADRHRGNIKVDDPLNPKELDVFDHDRALFGVEPNQGSQRLDRLTDRLGVSAGTQTGETRHCFLDELRTNKYFHKWLQRIATLPDWFLDDICRDIVGLGATREEADSALMFLKHRKRQLARIVQRHREKFTSITPWGLLL